MKLASPWRMRRSTTAEIAAICTSCVSMCAAWGGAMVKAMVMVTIRWR